MHFCFAASGAEIHTSLMLRGWKSFEIQYLNNLWIMISKSAFVAPSEMLFETRGTRNAVCVCVCVFLWDLLNLLNSHGGQRLVCIGSQGCRKGGAGSGSEGGVFSLYRGSPTAPYKLCCYHRRCERVFGKSLTPSGACWFPRCLPMLPGLHICTSINKAAPYQKRLINWSRDAHGPLLTKGC